MFNKGDKVNVTPVAYPNVKWPGKVIGSRKHKYLGVTFKVEYDCGGFTLTESFQEKELTKA